VAEEVLDGARRIGRVLVQRKPVTAAPEPSARLIAFACL
jgi:hypothetical protein